MPMFEVQGNEYELQINFKSVKYLNSLYDGGALQLLGKVITGDLDTFVHIAHAALFHTEKNFALKTIESEIEKQFMEGKLDLNFVMNTANDIISNSFFYKQTMEKMLSTDPRLKAQLDLLLK
ncbi:hypothetical protein COI63_25385 [Bacillus toyonensis]|nr:hypothetical protein CN594_26430 [Bacillus toyonensis]PEO51247.1 hypothetical protein CN579_28415 [Bacillus toyonensis]PFY36893.1 hypothetical protein COL55_28440 [Bacillus toyonensis]PFY43896.1 hypothetical protein COL54_12470 [Bacillus toyonensis]PFY73579.1 hypothetical protein COL62_24365 [Bacillus toyonensis]